LKNSIQKIDPQTLDEKAKQSDVQSWNPNLPKSSPLLIGEIRTPETSKAVETVSLTNSRPEINKSPLKQSASTKEEIQTVGIRPENSKNAAKIASEFWEDPDLNEPSAPIQLEVVPGAKRRYQQAFKIYSNGDYAASIEHFNRFLIDFPNDQDSDNSQYWIGKSHFQLGNYLEAELAVRKILKNYAHGVTREGYKTPDAALMLGRIYLIRKKPIKARYYFSHVIQRYSDSRSAVKAKKEIQAMNPL